MIGLIVKINAKMQLSYFAISKELFVRNVNTINISGKVIKNNISVKNVALELLCEVAQ